MYTEEDKTKIANLLRDCRQLTNPGKLKRIPGNYAQLKEAALLQELSLEVQKLTALFSPDATNEVLLQQSFLRLCAQREEQNQGTCMSYTASPEGICNGLYLEIAIILFKPRHFGELIAVLLPGMKASLTAELVFSQTYTSGAASLKAEEKLEVALKEEPFSAFADYPAQRSMLTQVVTGDNVVFNLESVANVPLRLREQFHRLMIKYPALKNKIYKHNDDLQQLWFDLELINQHGATPDEMLRHLSNELLRAGTRFTGNVHAGSSVTGACSQFRHYLDQLPTDLEETLVAMCSTNGADSLAKVLEHLADAKCVEDAAERIKKIRENPANKELLNSHPGTTKEQEHKLKQKYEKAIDVTGFENTNKLPEKLKQALIKNIRIKSAYDYIDLLLNLPQEEYRTFLTHATIACNPPLPAELASATNMLNTEQTTAFFNALFAQKDKFGGTRAIVFFAVKSNIAEKVLQAVPENERRSLINVTDEKNTSLLALAAQNSNPEIWKSLWGQLSAEDRSEFINHRNNSNYTLMHFAACNNNPEILRTLLDWLPDQERLAYLKNKHSGRKSPLDVAIENNNPAILQTIWHCLSAEDYRKTITDKDLSLIVKVVESNNPENLRPLIAYLKQHNLMCVLDKSGDNQNILHRSTRCRNPEIARILLDALTEQEMKALLKEEYNDDSRRTPLELAVWIGNRDVFIIMMGYLTDDERFAALRNGIPLRMLAKTRTDGEWSKIWGLVEDKNKFASLFLEAAQLCPLHEASRNSNTKIWHDLWGALTSTQRADFLKRTVITDDGFNVVTLLQYLAAEGNFEAWSNVWELHPENDRAAIIGETYENGETILHCAARNPNQEVTRAILQFLSAHNLLTALNIERDHGTTPLHVAVKNNNASFLFELLELIPAKDRLTLLKKKSSDGNSVVHKALTSAACWRVLWQLLPADDRVSALKEKNKRGELPLHWAITENSPVLSVMLTPLSQQERMLILSQTDSLGRTPLYRALQCKSEVWGSIWNYMPEQLRLSEIKEKKHGGTLLHLAASKNNPELVVAILRLLPAQDRLAALTEKDAEGNTPLHSAACLNDNEMLLNMLEYLPSQDYLTAIRTKNKVGYSVLHTATVHAENFYALLQALPNGDRLTALEAKNDSGLNPLNIAINTRTAAIFIKLHELLTLNEIAVLLKAKDNHGNNSLHGASDFSPYNRIIPMILNMLSEDERLLMLSEKNELGNTPLHFMARTQINGLSEVWTLFTDKARFTSLFTEQQNNEGVCPLHLVAQNENQNMWIWNNLWGTLTAKQKTAFAKKEIKKGKRLLHVAAEAAYLDVWKQVWAFHSEQERLIAVAEKSADGLNIVHWVTHNTLEVSCDIVQFLSEHNLSSLLTAKSNDGNTPIHSAIINTNAYVLYVLMESIPLQERLTILRQQNADGNAPLQMAAVLSNSGCWKVIWQSLSAHDRLRALTEALRNNNIPQFRRMMQFLSQPERPEALKAKNGVGNTVLHHYLAETKTETNIGDIMDILHQEERLLLVTEKNTFGQTPLDMAAENKNLEVWSKLWSLLTDEERKVGRGNLIAQPKCTHFQTSSGSSAASGDQHVYTRR